MTIAEVEERTGLARSNIRFYEKEGLLKPSQEKSSGYRNYSEEDVDCIQKIAFLRTLGISVEDIGKIISGKLSLYQTVERQSKKLQEQFYYRRAGKAGVCGSHQCSDTKQRPAPGTQAGGKGQPSVPGSGAEPAADERRTGTHRNRPDEIAL